MKINFAKLFVLIAVSMFVGACDKIKSPSGPTDPPPDPVDITGDWTGPATLVSCVHDVPEDSHPPMADFPCRKSGTVSAVDLHIASGSARHFLTLDVFGQRTEEMFLSVSGDGEIRFNTTILVMIRGNNWGFNRNARVEGTARVSGSSLSGSFTVVFTPLAGSDEKGTVTERREFSATRRS